MKLNRGEPGDDLSLSLDDALLVNGGILSSERTQTIGLQAREIFCVIWNRVSVTQAVVAEFGMVAA